MSPLAIEAGVAKLQALWNLRNEMPEARAEYGRIGMARDEVLARYQPVFATANLANLTEGAFREFLLYKNNRHWLSLQRKGPAICTDMARLRSALAILVDESRPLAQRLNELVPARGPGYVPHLGKAVLTPILLVHAPERYAVWNAISEDAMRKLDLWPEPESGAPLGDRYAKVNEVCVRVAAAVGVDLWTLDALWFRVAVPFGPTTVVPAPEAPDGADIVIGEISYESASTFGMERHLHEFLRDNWEHTELGREWKLLEEDGDSDAGYEYSTDVGRIDLLARHRSEPRWLVVELKRQQTSDQTVGQVLRYMGWVKRKKAQAGERVEGLIVAHSNDEAIRYALAAVADVSLRLYEVEFRLKQARDE